MVPTPSKKGLSCMIKLNGAYSFKEGAKLNGAYSFKDSVRKSKYG